MIAATLHAPPPLDRRPWVPAGTTRHGRLYRRPLLTTGRLWHPVLGDVEVDLPLLHRLVTNFRAGLTGYVAVTTTDERGQRDEDPSRTVGEVVAMAVRGDQLVADIDIRDPACLLAVLEPAVTFASSYTDTRTGRPAGPAVTTLHLLAIPNEGAQLMKNIRTPGVRFRVGDDGIARPVVVRPGEDAAEKLRVSLARSDDAEIARLSAQAVEMGLTRSPAGTAPTTPVVSTARLVDRYVAQARDLGVTGPGSSSAPGSMPSLGR